MEWNFSPLDRRQAEAILTWRYEPPYDFYNLGGDDPGDLLDPTYQYFAVTDSTGRLLGYCCFGVDARVPGREYPEDGSLDVGVGLRPDLTGSGLGAAFLAAVLEHGRREFNPAAFRTTVAAFNERSRRMCARAGFRPVQRFSRAGGDVEFVVLSMAV